MYIFSALIQNKLEVCFSLAWPEPRPGAVNADAETVSVCLSPLRSPMRPWTLRWIVQPVTRSPEPSIRRLRAALYPLHYPPNLPNIAGLMAEGWDVGCVWMFICVYVWCSTPKFYKKPCVDRKKGCAKVPSECVKYCPNSR